MFDDIIRFLMVFLFLLAPYAFVFYAVFGGQQVLHNDYEKYPELCEHALLHCTMAELQVPSEGNPEPYRSRGQYIFNGSISGFDEERCAQAASVCRIVEPNGFETFYSLLFTIFRIALVDDSKKGLLIHIRPSRSSSSDGFFHCDRSILRGICLCHVFALHSYSIDQHIHRSDIQCFADRSILDCGSSFSSRTHRSDSQLRMAFLQTETIADSRNHPSLLFTVATELERYQFRCLWSITWRTTIESFDHRSTNHGEATRTVRHLSYSITAEIERDRFDLGEDSNRSTTFSTGHCRATIPTTVTGPFTTTFCLFAPWTSPSHNSAIRSSACRCQPTKWSVDWIGTIKRILGRDHDRPGRSSQSAYSSIHWFGQQ